MIDAPDRPQATSARSLLSRRESIAYSVLALPLAAIGVSFYVFLPKLYADYAGVSLQTMGAIVVGTRIWDAVIGPAIGHLSDRTRLSSGRRRPWIVAGSVPLMAVFIVIFMPDSMSALSPALRLTLLSALFFLFWSCVAVPYEALGAELVTGYDERTSVLGLRDGLLVVGTLVAGAVPAILELFLPSSTVTERFAMMALVHAAIFCAALVALMICVRERPLRDNQRPSGSLLDAWGALKRNRPFLILLVSYAVSAFGGALPATLILFYVERVLHSPHGFLFLVLYLAVGVLFLPLWIRAAARFDKRNVWIAAMLINTVAFAAVFPLGSGDTALYGALVTLSAVGYGATLALPSSMQVDVIDYDEWLVGTRREGQIVGLWTIARQLSSAVGTGAALWLLGSAGYLGAGGLEAMRDAAVAIDDISGGDINHREGPDSIADTLRLLYAGVPSVTSMIAILIAMFYPLDRTRYEEIRRQLDERKSESST